MATKSNRIPRIALFAGGGFLLLVISVGVFLFRLELGLRNAEIQEDGEVFRLTAGDAGQYFVIEHDLDRPSSDPDIVREIDMSIYLIPARILAGPEVPSVADYMAAASRLTPIGFCNRPCWNFQGDKIAYLDSRYLRHAGGVRIVVLDVFTGHEISYPVNMEEVRKISWNRAGDQIAYPSRDWVCLLDLASRKTIKVCRLPNAESLSMAPDGNWIACMTRDGLHVNDSDGWRLNVISVKTGSVEKVGETADAVGMLPPFRWALDSTSVEFLQWPIVPSGVRAYETFRYHLKTGDIEKVRTDEEVAERFRNFDIQAWRYWTFPPIKGK